MILLRTIATELLGLFVDDGALALLALVLIALVTAAIKILGLPPFLGGLGLLIGYLAILAESVHRFARQKQK